ncbi:flavodoxin family protein, partial [Vibrio cholerae]
VTMKIAVVLGTSKSDGNTRKLVEVFQASTGRCLKGKSVSVISTGFNKACPSCFSEPFQLTADYLGLVYKGCTYVSVQSEDDLSKLKETTRQALEIVT